jgi:hypothetical protein
MNWRGGLFRLWLAASVIWIAYIFWWREICLVPAFLGGGGWGCDDKTVDPAGENLKSLALILGAPAAILVVGRAIFWIGNGFRNR